jgi:RNA polymerase sigma factor (sigma-70 family)
MDPRLRRRLLDGDKEAQREYASNHGQGLKPYLRKEYRRYGLSEEDIGEIANDMLMAFFQCIHKWDPDACSDRTYLFAMAPFCVKKFLRRDVEWRKLKIELSVELLASTREDGDSEASASSSNHLVRKVLWLCIQALPSRQREVIEARIALNWPEPDYAADVSERLNLKERDVRVYMKRALDNLKDAVPKALAAAPTTLAPLVEECTCCGAPLEEISFSAGFCSVCNEPLQTG